MVHPSVLMFDLCRLVASIVTEQFLDLVAKLSWQSYVVPHLFQIFCVALNYCFNAFTVVHEDLL